MLGLNRILAPLDCGSERLQRAVRRLATFGTAFSKPDIGNRSVTVGNVALVSSKSTSGIDQLRSVANDRCLAAKLLCQFAASVIPFSRGAWNANGSRVVFLPFLMQ